MRENTEVKTMSKELPLSEFVESFYGLIEKKLLGFTKKDGKPVPVLEFALLAMYMNSGKPTDKATDRWRISRKVLMMLSKQSRGDLATEKLLKGLRVFTNFVSKAHPDMGMKTLADDEVMDFAVVEKGELLYVGELDEQGWRIRRV